MSGMAYLTGYYGEEPMLQSGLSYGDPLSGMNAAFALVAALINRRRTQTGIHVELSQVEGLISFNADSIMDYTMNGRVRERIGNRDHSMAPHGCYRCEGVDQWVTIAIASDDVWQKFGAAIGHPAWAGDKKFADTLSRYENQDELNGLIESWTIAHNPYAIMQLLQKAGVAAGPVLDARELIAEPHLNARGLFEVTQHPVAGAHPEIGAYALFSKTPISIRKPAPCLGEDNHYIFKQLLHLADTQIIALEDKGIIGTQPSLEQQGSM
jgi:crotonobetainyl-CoA:carnitine CoA-transferase CaiB-like acyl-CoA transferase